MGKITMKKHSAGRQAILAAADISVLGKKYSTGALVLDLAKFRSFYEGETTDVGELAAAIKSCDSANLVGSLCVESAINAGLAGRESIVVIGGIPHLQLYRIDDTRKGI